MWIITASSCLGVEENVLKNQRWTKYTCAFNSGIDQVNILHSVSFKPQNGFLVLFGPQAVFLHPEGIFSLSSYLVWLSGFGFLGLVGLFGEGWVFFFGGGGEEGQRWHERSSSGLMH